MKRLGLVPLLPLLLLGLPSGFARGAAMPACPAWDLTVVNPAGQPIAGAAVLQLWGGNFPQGYVGGQTNVVTDAEGRVSLPARQIEAPPAASAWRQALRKLGREIAPSPVASVHVSHPGYRTAWISSLRDPRVVATRNGLRTQLVLEPEPARP